MAEIDELERPDRRALREHLEGPDFLLGEHRGRWKLLSVNWPHATIEVSAAERGDSPRAYALRFECSGYPSQAVTAGLWDEAANAPLAHNLWPHGSDRFMAVFRVEWKSGLCLYLPCDRQSFEGHPQWLTDHPAQVWDPAKGIVLYLEAVHELLNSSSYHGKRS